MTEEDKRIVYLLQIAEKMVSVNPALSQHYIIKAQTLCKKRKIDFPSSFSLLFCPHCACIANCSNTSSFRVMPITANEKTKYRDRVERVCRICGKRIQMNGVLTEQLKPLRSKVQSLSSNQTSNTGPKERKKHNIKRQAEKLLKSKAKSQAKPMRKDW
ncbi:hypothetical protein WA588_004679, partial [Blastocystis sp. NMH]